MRPDDGRATERFEPRRRAALRHDLGPGPGALRVGASREPGGGRERQSRRARDGREAARPPRRDYVCDQRIYPSPPGPHISAWEWAFPDEPAALADLLAKELQGAEREGRTFRFKNDGGEVEVVVSVEAATATSGLRCAQRPAAAKSVVVASRM